MTALTTEHFTLQGARSQTASESASRASLYILSVSSTLVALGFIGQASQIGDAFDAFALTVLPTLYVLGVFTFVRVVECGAQAKLFLLSGHDDGRGVFENATVPHERRKRSHVATDVRRGAWPAAPSRSSRRRRNRTRCARWYNG